MSFLLKWLIFGILIVTSPVAIELTYLLLVGKFTEVYDLVQGGKILIIALGILGATTGELIFNENSKSNMCFISCCIICITLVAAAYGMTFILSKKGEPVDHLVANTISLGAYVTSVCLSLFTTYTNKDRTLQEV
ncbi:hypothetical protein [Maridesulfovibrio sp.]|uniref:hypothetical protein n=1 Tax=Maridesulfovibrio sp. TaxID=2795000 RepID=UPI002A18E4DD|nr:hypothetical protein [Maridesulfovibrio sp.]